LLFVDVERAVLESPEGKRAAIELEAERARVDSELAVREQEIAGVRKKLEKDPRARVEYQNAAAAYEELVKTKQAALEASQDRRFGPLIDQIDARMKKASTDQVLLVDVADHPPLFPVSACDATEAIMRGSAVKAAAECRARAVFVVDLDKVMRSLEESKRATARLDSFQRERQAELDQRSRQIEAQGGVDVEARRLELADRYAAYRKELAEREAKELAAMRALAIARIQEKKAAYPGAVFVERVEEVTPIAGSCDVSRFFAGDDPAGLGSACAAWRESAR
jgi:Skp family chaperone for outer membrane proteins